MKGIGHCVVTLFVGWRNEFEAWTGLSPLKRIPVPTGEFKTWEMRGTLRPSWMV